MGDSSEGPIYKKSRQRLRADCFVGSVTPNCYAQPAQISNAQQPSNVVLPDLSNILCVLGQQLQLGLPVLQSKLQTPKDVLYLNLKAWLLGMAGCYHESQSLCACA